MSPLEDRTPREEDDGGGWLTSYADLMTLIACFFILMMAFANYDPAGFNKKAKELSKHFTQGKYKSSEVKMDQISEELSRHPELMKKLKISLKDSSLILTFSGSTLFEAGQYKMKDESTILLDSLIDIIKSINPSFRILVEGHADKEDDILHSVFKSSWILSAARSATVIERFEFYGFDPQKLIMIGKGDTSPLVDSFNKKGEPIKENQLINRRVTIKVLEPLSETKKIKLGLGVYFKDATE